MIDGLRAELINGTGGGDSCSCIVFVRASSTGAAGEARCISPWVLDVVSGAGAAVAGSSSEFRDNGAFIKDVRIGDVSANVVYFEVARPVGEKGELRVQKIKFRLIDVPSDIVTSLPSVFNCILQLQTFKNIP